MRSVTSHLAGDLVAVGEVLAARSAPELVGIAARLAARGEEPAFLPHHVAFTDWKRSHARDPSTWTGLSKNDRQ